MTIATREEVVTAESLAIVRSHFEFAPRSRHAEKMSKHVGINRYLISEVFNLISGTAEVRPFRLFGDERFLLYIDIFENRREKNMFKALKKELR